MAVCWGKSLIPVLPYELKGDSSSSTVWVSTSLLRTLASVAVLLYLSSSTFSESVLLIYMFCDSPLILKLLVVTVYIARIGMTSEFVSS